MNKYHRPSVNLDKLWSLVSDQTRQYYKDKTDGPVPVIDVIRAVSVKMRSAVPSLLSLTSAHIFSNVELPGFIAFR